MEATHLQKYPLESIYRVFMNSSGQGKSVATGWAGDGAVQDQIDATVKDGVKRAQSQLPRGPSLTHCAECGNEIPQARREAFIGVHLCVACQEEHDRDAAKFAGYNRRGSKDSQLR
jgi:phage/conjugal plasmid C-4 type zinc finger TraR family protein